MIHPTTKIALTVLGLTGTLGLLCAFAPQTETVSVETAHIQERLQRQNALPIVGLDATATYQMTNSGATKVCDSVGYGQRDSGSDHSVVVTCTPRGGAPFAMYLADGLVYRVSALEAKAR